MSQHSASSSEEASSSSFSIEESSFSEESLGILVAEQYSLGATDRTIDMRSRKLISEDLLHLMHLWPADVHVLNLERNMFSVFIDAGFPSGLRELNLAHNRLSKLDGVKFPPLLSTLDLSHNLLYFIGSPSLHLVNLKILNIEGNRLKASNAVQVIFQCAAFCTSLESLRLGGNRYTEADLHEELSNYGLPVDDFLSRDQCLLANLSYTIQKFDRKESSSEQQKHAITQQELGAKACSALHMIAQVAAQKHSTLVLPDDLSLLLNSERADFHLRSLLQKLSYFEDGPTPAECFPHSRSAADHTLNIADRILRLNLTACNLNSSSHHILKSVLQRLPKILELNLSMNCFREDTVFAVLEEASPSLKKLILRNACICASGLMAAENKSLTKLVSINFIDLSDNTELQDAGFVRFLQSCPPHNLLNLYASNCGIDFSKCIDVVRLERFLSIFRTASCLQALDLSHNPLGCPAVEEIMRSLSCHPRNVELSNHLVSNMSSGSSPLTILNLSCTACEKVDEPLKYYFDWWFNCILARFSNLTHLYLSENHSLFHLSSGVSALCNLQFIDLSNCKNLLFISDELVSGMGSTRFDLRGCNSLKHPPNVEADKGQDSVRAYFRRIEKEEINHVKVILLGSSRSGKRSLLRAIGNIQDCDPKSFVEVNSSILKNYQSRKGILASVFGQSSDLSLTFWNFPGNSEYYPHVNFYMASHHCIYIVVFSVLDSLEVMSNRICFWLRCIMNSARAQQSIRILLVGSRIDAVHVSFLDKHKTVIRELIEKVLKSMGIFSRVEKKCIFLDLWFSSSPNFPGHKDSIERLTKQIFKCKAELLKDLGTRLFPKCFRDLKEEVRKLNDLCVGRKKFPLIKLADITQADGCRILVGSHQNFQILDAIKLLSEVGYLIYYSDSHGEPWICVNMSFGVDFVTLFTDYIQKLVSQATYSNDSIMSRDEFFRIFQSIFSSSLTSVSWYSSSLSEGHPEALFGFLEAQGLLVPVSSQQITPSNFSPKRHSSFLGHESHDDTLFMSPLFLKEAPESWREVLAPMFGVDACASPPAPPRRCVRVSGSRFSSLKIDFMITVSSFLSLMLSKRCKSRSMWGFSFVYSVEGTSIFVRLAENRRGLDVVTVGPDVPISATINLEIQSLIFQLGFLHHASMKRLCPLCCTSDSYIQTALVRDFSQQQLEHHKTFKLDVVCHRGHSLSASTVEEGSILEICAPGNSQLTVFPNVCLDHLPVRKTLLWLDDDPHQEDIEQIRRGILGYVGVRDEDDGGFRVLFDFTDVKPENQMNVHCFASVDAITAFMLQHHKLAHLPSSLLRIISNRRLFVGEHGLCKFLDDPSTPWAYSFPSTMIFYGGNPEGLDILEGRPNAFKSTFTRDCISFVTFGYVMPAFDD